MADRRALRIEERATGDGPLPAGTAVVRDAIDGEGVVPAGGTLVLDLEGSPAIPADNADLRSSLVLPALLGCMGW